MKLSAETLIPIGVVICLFLMAMLCLACSLNTSELIDCFCCPWRRPRDPNNTPQDDSADPQEYESLNEFIFQAQDEECPGLVSLAMNSMPTETTVQAVFPDLLEDQNNSPGKGRRRTNQDRIDDNGDLNEPLL
jgi:hypothetical protein